MGYKEDFIYIDENGATRDIHVESVYSSIFNTNPEDMDDSDRERFLLVNDLFDYMIPEFGFHAEPDILMNLDEALSMCSKIGMVVVDECCDEDIPDFAKGRKYRAELRLFSGIRLPAIFGYTRAQAVFLSLFMFLREVVVQMDIDQELG